MKMFKDLSVKSKLFLAFAIIVLIAIAGNLIILDKLHAFQRNVNTLRELRHTLDLAQDAVWPDNASIEITQNNIAVLEEAQQKLAREIVSASYYLIGTVLSVGLLAGYGISSYHSRALRSLEMAAEALGRGEFAARIPVDSEDEIGRLGRALNKMARALQDEKVRSRLGEITKELGESYSL